MKSNEETIRAMFDASPDTIMILDEHEFIDCNPATLKMFMCSEPEEFLGRHPSEYSPPTQADGVSSLESANEKISTAYKTGSNLFEWAHQRLNGEVFPAEVQLTLLRLKERNVLQATVRDITERKQAEERLLESERKYQLWLDVSPVCTKIVDLDFNLQFMSAAGIEQLKIDDITQYYGKPYPLSFYPDSFRIPMTKNLKKAKETGEIITQEAFVVDVEGNELWYSSTIAPIEGDRGLVDYFVIVSSEITDRKLAEDEVKKHIDELNLMNSFMVKHVLKMEELRKENRALKLEIEQLHVKIAENS